ncbi:cytochrome biogenesis protein [Neisseria gonorrhoeae]|uniref:Cytochrome biogenesis protein n=1 Tax=Neisseria gonorrhoeae TaxID=485 RepID=A0A378VZV3_NEIGO|nr:cytochrome biogenesis protein [Neisseria gonorrhoeae]
MRQGRRSNIKLYAADFAGQRLFWLTGTRSGLQQQYRWLRIPLDKQLKADTFMALREFLKDGKGANVWLPTQPKTHLPKSANNSCWLRKTR